MCSWWETYGPVASSEWPLRWARAPEPLASIRGQHDGTQRHLPDAAPGSDLAVGKHDVARVSEVADQDVPPTSHPLPLTNVFREDVVTPGLTAEQALAMAPATDQQRFSVPRILGDEQ